jgi:DMSO/TMAO reductase YedYZ molybdopterin-dependent catalytic subunit
MRLSRNLKIGLFFSIIIGITIPLIVYNFLTIENPSPWTVKIYGNVENEVYISYDDIVAGVYGLVENREFYFINSYGTEHYYNYTGVSVWYILNQTDVLTNTSSEIIFRAIDNYYTYEISLTEMAANPEYAILAFKRDGQILQPKESGGEGPLRAIVDYELTKPRVNSQYWAKYTNSIQVK